MSGQINKMSDQNEDLKGHKEEEKLFAVVHECYFITIKNKKQV